MKKIGIVGSTGSIGRQALDVISRNPDKFEVVFLSCNSNTDLLKKQGLDFKAKYICSTDRCEDGVVCGQSQISDLIKNEDLDMVLLAAVGAAGTVYAFDTVRRGIDLALANKESLVASGRLLTDLAKKTGSKILPVDSEHSAIFQCLEGHNKKFLEKITLTASGGSFRNTPADAMAYVSLSQALKHPNWSMGAKITVDSATMMNKGLELIEARFLFDVTPDYLDVVIHPQSVVHSFVSYRDGSMIAQMGRPDMRTPISYAFSYPERCESGVRPLSLAQVGTLNFYEPDLVKYPCLKTGIEVLKKDSNGPMIVMNAANEIAVADFIAGKINFTDISCVINAVLDVFCPAEPASLEEVLSFDGESRDRAMQAVKRFYK